MPSRCTSASTTSDPKASAARMAALAAASCPSTSARRVALGQAQLLRLAQHVVVVGALLLHAGEDVVGRPVDDPHDAHDLLAGERLAQGPDDGDGARHGRLVEEIDAGGGGRLGQLGARGGQQRLVGRDHGLAVAQGGLHQLVGRVQPADHLDDHVDVVAGDERGGVGGDQVGADGGRARFGGVGHGDPHQLQADAGAGGDVVGAGEEDLGQRSPDVAAAEQRDAHRRCGVRMGVGGGTRRGLRPFPGLVGGHLQTVQAART